MKKNLVPLLCAIAGVLWLVPALKSVIKGEPLNYTFLTFAFMFFTFAFFFFFAAGRKSGGGSGPPTV